MLESDHIIPYLPKGSQERIDWNLSDFYPK